MKLGNTFFELRLSILELERQIKDTAIDEMSKGIYDTVKPRYDGNQFLTEAKSNNDKHY